VTDCSSSVRSDLIAISNFFPTIRVLAIASRPSASSSKPEVGSMRTMVKPPLSRMFSKERKSIIPETEGHPLDAIPIRHALTFAPDQVVQLRNSKFKIEAFDSSEPTFDIAGEQLGILGGELFAWQECCGRAFVIDD